MTDATAAPFDASSADATRADAPPAAGVTVHLGGVTDVGRIREHNEDNFLVADLTARGRVIDDESSRHGVGPRGLLLAVCDGMGGAAAGEVASQMAVDVIHAIVQDGEAPADREAFAHRLVLAVQEAGARIFLAAKSNRERRGMGTTATVAGVFDKTLFVAQVGDSRAYLLRGGRLRQITRDQSLVSKLIDAGQLGEEEAESYEHAHIILQALGTADLVTVDLSYVDLCQGDAVMLCSDGLSGLATFEQIADAVAHTDDPVACCHRLIAAANEAGGHDNITVITARFEGDLPAAAREDLAIGYQPYVLDAPVEAIIGASASTSFKLPEVPPPGSDVKHSLSMPPDMPTTMAEPARAASDPPVALDETTRRDLGIDGAPNVLAWVLVALAVAVLALAAYLALRPRAAATEGEAPATVDAGAPEPTPVGQGTPVPAAAPPAP